MAIITIPRGTKSHGAELAKRLSERLGYVCKSREVVLEGAKKYNIMAKDLFEQLEESPGFWQKLTGKHERYLIYVQCALLDAVKQDNVIYHGHAGQIFLGDISHVLKVRIDAPKEERVGMVMQELGKSFDEASDYIAKLDDDRMRWFKRVCGGEWRDPLHYDISFNTRNMTIDTICEIIAMTVTRPEFKTSPESARRLNDLSLECEVRAAFASDDKLWTVPVTVEAEDSTVVLRGTVKDKSFRDMFAELAAQVKGVAKVESKIGLTTDPLSKGVYGHD